MAVCVFLKKRKEKTECSIFKNLETFSLPHIKSLKVFELSTSWEEAYHSKSMFAAKSLKSILNQ
jgi:hypothetical protein